MMSCASTSSTCSWEHDVFLSFRGEDTRMGFTGHLYTALTSKGIRTFKDDKKLEIGDTISTELIRAIEKSRFAVVVLSTKFATSKWCLEEIAKVVDCREQGKLIVIPVFYHVSPSDVRHQTASFKQAFANHQMDPQIIPNKVETWREAFKKLGDISGDHVTEHRDESEVVQKIVRRIFKEMQDTVPTDAVNRLVGMESRVKEVKSILSMQSSEVRFIGICGMSGMGKTTLAQVVYKRIKGDFEKHSFMENIKGVSKEDDSRSLRDLQQKLLYDIFKEKIHVESVSDGQNMLGSMLRGWKIIVVLDDVNHVDQLTYMAGSREWFGPGTRVIITTTNKELLHSSIIDEIYTCEELNGDEALRLFCQSAFKKGHPTHGFEKLSVEILELAGGLPLALNVYGSLLCGKDEDYWKEMLKKLREYSHEEILERLEVVYARLDRYQRHTFIYIACFLKGRSIHLVKDILANIGLYPECGIADLTNKFLITINHDDNVWVHDLLQQMCWQVLHKESERRDGRHIAIKYRHAVESILSSEPKGTRTIEIINQEPYKVEGAPFFDDHNCFSKMMKLKFLRISKIDFPEGLHHLSNDLRILEWYGCSLKSLPTTFKPRHIFELEMCYSQLETLWEKDLDLPSMRSINLSFSKDLTKIPDLTSTPNLEKLNLEGCTKLTELHKSVLLHKRLQYMNLKGCASLESLGRSTMEMEALEALILSGCSSLEYIPEFEQNMKRLEHLYVDGTRIKKLPENLGEMCDLRKLDVSGTSVEELPSSICHLKKLRLLCVQRCQLSSTSRGFLYTNLNTLSYGLRELDLSDCNLIAVPGAIGLLHHLINLDLSRNDFVSLPACIGLLSNLRMLCLNHCTKLQSLPKLSIANAETDYGQQSRFSYYISGKSLDVSQYHSTSNYSIPTVSCLNCPELAVNETGCFLSEKILNNYLKLRTKYWTTPEAVFEIVDGGSEIPSGFKQLRPDEILILEGRWIGVAICAVISVDHVNDYMEPKYVVTAHIHDGETHWKIPALVNFWVAGLDSQLVFCWTLADDLLRMVDTMQRSFNFSLSVNPGDGNLQVTSFGVRIIRDKDIQRLRQLEDSTSEAVNNLFRATLSFLSDLQWYIACETDTNLHFFHSAIHDFIPDNRRQYPVDGINGIIKCLIEFNQELLCECKEEWGNGQLFPLVYEYYRISRGTSALYNVFVRLLKDVSDSWLSVKLALEQIVVKSRAEDYTWEEMLQQLNDLEAAESVRFSDNFVISFAYICKQTLVFLSHLNEEIQRNNNFTSLEVLAKVSSVTVAGVISMVAAYFGGYKLLQEMKNITSYSSLLHAIQSFSRKSDEWFILRERHTMSGYGRELRISDFCANAYLIHELKKLMRKSNRVTFENKMDMMMAIDKLEKTTGKFSAKMEDMSSHAHKYCHDIREMGITLNLFVADAHKFERCIIRDEDIQRLQPHEDSTTSPVQILKNIMQHLEHHIAELRAREDVAQARVEEARVREEEALTRVEEACAREEEARARVEEARARAEETQARVEEARVKEEVAFQQMEAIQKVMDDRKAAYEQMFYS